jgi:hypothetical protein
MGWSRLIRELCFLTQLAARVLRDGSLTIAGLFKSGLLAFLDGDQWLKNKFVLFTRLSGIILALSIFTSARAFQSQKDPIVRVTVHDESDKPLPGVTVELKLKGAVVSSATSDDKGELVFNNVQPGTYQVAVSKEEFQPDSQDNVVVEPATPIEIVFVLSPKIKITDTVTVKPAADPAVETGTVAPSQLQASQIKAVPTKPATVSDALPYIPGVVRTPQGELKISGRDENRSALIVNSQDVTDPATGQFGVTVPVDSVQSVSVFQTPYLAEFGRFTAGVVSVETRRGGDKWDYELNDPLPDFRIFSGHLRGVRDATPRVVFNGPLMPGRLFFSEGFEYEIKKTPIKTLPFPDNETRNEGVNSFTQFDYIASNTQTLTATLHVAPWHSNFVNLDFFNPQPVSPAFSAKDYTGAVTDRLSLGSNLLESTVGVKMFTGSVWGQGQQDMTLTPVGNLGNYFSQQSRDGSRVEWLETYSFSPMKAYGTHNVKVGSSISRTTNDGQFTARTVNIDGLDGALLKKIEFVGGSPFNRHDLETAFFAEDHWVIKPNLSMDMGVRWDRQGITETFRVAPRMGLAWAPGKGNSTVIRGGFGIFYDRVPLGVYSFDKYPEQLVTTYGPAGQIIDGPRLFVNITDRAAANFLFIHSGKTIGNFAPYSATWNVEVDRKITDKLRIRANYLQSNSYGGIIVSPQVISGQDALVLGGGGKSRYRQFELTSRWNLTDGGQVFFSYVHSQSLGDINGFNNYLGNYPFPVVRPDEFSHLPGDIPNRFLAWGMIKLPWMMRISPLVEYRNGFPYSTIDQAQNFVGLPNANRYPAFYSLDARLSKDIKLSDKYTVRFSVSGFNLTDHFNPTAVHYNIADPQFGLFFGSYQRKFTMDFDVIF